MLKIGIVGAGGFAAFAAKAFQRVEGISVEAITDIHESSARILAEDVDAKVCNHYETLLTQDIDLVYIATPPYLHYAQSKMALEAGKHVICEKPAALKTTEAEELADYARNKGLLYTVNLMQRYNPLYHSVKKIIDENWLGEFVHGYFENYASDEKLIPEHWFWDEEQSGGIFIEHGVHFFDMFYGWFGPGKLVHAMEIQRPDVEGVVIDQVQAVVLYHNKPVNLFHGFNQPKVLDRQELRLQFEYGDITLYEWVPVKIRLHGLLLKVNFEKLRALFPGSTIEIFHNPDQGQQVVRGKFKSITYDVLVTMEAGYIQDKMRRYEELVIAMITDQWKWIQNNKHQRVIDETNAVESLRIAEEATLKAERFMG